MKTSPLNRTQAHHIRLILTASLSALLSACATETIVYERVPSDGYEGQALSSDGYAGSNYGATGYGTTGYGATSGAITVQIEPPMLPEYVQPPCPQDGYLWTPGYWAWNGGYYWVPGTWVGPPVIGFLWTPAYWGYSGGFYVFHGGYWGPHVGFYGGINYGGGYNGSGYYGGRWDRGHFAYNTAVTNVNTTIIHNTYNVTVVNNNGGPRVSHNGGVHGTFAMPTPAEQRVERERHTALTPDQMRHITEARQNRDAFATVNQGHPPVAATARPAVFSGAGVVPARAPTTPPPLGNGSGGNGAPFPNGERNNLNRERSNGQGPDSTRPAGQAPRPAYAPPVSQPSERMDRQPGTPPSTQTDSPALRPEMAAPRYEPRPRSEPAPRYEAPMQRPEIAAPRPERAQPHYEAAPPRSEAPAPRPERAAPTPEWAAPRAERAAPHYEVVQPRSEAAAPRPTPAPMAAPRSLPAPTAAPRNAPDKERPDHDKH